MKNFLRDYFVWNKQTLGLAILGVVLGIEVIGYVVMRSLGIDAPEFMTLIITTLTVLAGVVGAQTLNGKINKTS